MEPTTTVTIDPGALHPPARQTTRPQSATGTASLVTRWSTVPTDQHLVTETLEWIAGQLGANRARFVRLLPNGVWIVQTFVQGTLFAQQADRAEIAMAWSVGLGRDIYRTARPRVATPDNNGVRPIAAGDYIAIPILCQQGVVGVIEAAGDLRPDAELQARAATERLARFATQLMFDPALRAEPRLTLDTECEITASLSASRLTHLTATDIQFINALEAPTPLGTLAIDLGVRISDLRRCTRSRCPRRDHTPHTDRRPGGFSRRTTIRASHTPGLGIVKHRRSRCPR